MIWPNSSIGANQISPVTNFVWDYSEFILKDNIFMADSHSNPSKCASVNNKLNGFSKNTCLSTGL